MLEILKSDKKLNFYLIALLLAESGKHLQTSPAFVEPILDRYLGTNKTVKLTNPE